jgi:hypothetical protein
MLAAHIAGDGDDEGGSFEELDDPHAPQSDANNDDDVGADGDERARLMAQKVLQKAAFDARYDADDADDDDDADAANTRKTQTGDADDTDAKSAPARSSKHPRQDDNWYTQQKAAMAAQVRHVNAT